MSSEYGRKMEILRVVKPNGLFIFAVILEFGNDRMA